MSLSLNPPCWVRRPQNHLAHYRQVTPAVDRQGVMSGWATIRSEPLMRSMRMPIHMTPVTGEDYAESAEQLVQRK
jgi:hypothetical protein